MPKYGKSETLTKPTYNVSEFGKDVSMPLGVDTLALESITWSALNELLQVSLSGSNVNLEKYPILVTDLDAMGIMHEGDGVRYSRSFDYLADMSMWIYKFNVTLAAALAVTAYTSGDHSIDSVKFVLTERKPDGTFFKAIDDKTISTGMSALQAVGSAVAILHYEGNKPFKIQQGNILRLEIDFNSTDTMVATSFEGVMPLFYFQEGSLPKLMSQSAWIIHLLPALSQAFPVMRDTDATNRLDFSGVTKDGETRK